MGPEERPQSVRQTAPPHASRFAGDLTKSCGGQTSRACQAAFVAAGEAAAATKKCCRTSNVHGNDYGLRETERNA
jgi:hypothetical protein